MVTVTFSREHSGFEHHLLTLVIGDGKVIHADADHSWLDLSFMP